MSALLLNFSHPYAKGEVDRLAALIGDTIRLCEVAVHVEDLTLPLAAVVAATTDDLALTPAEWQTTRVLVDLPGHSGIAGVLLADCHGRMGHFPTLVRRARASDGIFRVVEVVELDAVRQASRSRR